MHGALYTRTNPSGVRVPEKSHHETEIKHENRTNARIRHGEWLNDIKSGNERGRGKSRLQANQTASAEANQIDDVSLTIIDEKKGRGWV